MLECFKTMQHPPRLVPGRQDRYWMDVHGDRFPYKCLPLNIANTTGWELLCPFDFAAEWNGGNAASDIVIVGSGPERFVSSHFTHGVLTFETGYLFRTAPGVDIIASGVPNLFKHGIQPMTGIIETAWLPYTFTMNWRFTAPGVISFEKDEPFCFISLVQHRQHEDVTPVIRHFSEDPELAERHMAWQLARQQNQGQPHWGYFRGQPPEGGGPIPEDHINKRRLRCPVTGVEA